MTRTDLQKTAALAALVTGLSAPGALADIVQADDVIIQFSLCVGNDCVNGENFGFDTLRLKENNLRIHFDDTSGTGSFPSNDWRIIANDSANGGDSYLAVEDSTAGRQVFRVAAGAPANALIVASQGNVGIGDNTPVVELHVTDGDSPTLRLEQDGSSGFAAQTWDLAGNETNFFVRDVSGGSLLPFKIKPGAPTDTLFLAASGDIGVGTASPADDFHIRRAGSVAIRLESTDANTNPIRMNYNSNQDEFRITFDGSGGASEFQLDSEGNLELAGTVTTTGGTCGGGCDLVFDPDFERIGLEDHAQLMWANSYLPNVGPTVENAPINLTEKVGGMLNELEYAHIYIDQLHTRLAVLERQLGVVED